MKAIHIFREFIMYPLKASIQFFEMIQVPPVHICGLRSLIYSDQDRVFVSYRYYIYKIKLSSLALKVQGQTDYYRPWEELFIWMKKINFRLWRLASKMIYIKFSLSKQIVDSHESSIWGLYLFQLIPSLNFYFFLWCHSLLMGAFSWG